MKRLTFPPTSSRCRPLISAHCIVRLGHARLGVAGEGVDRLVVVVVAVEVLEVDVAAMVASPLAASHGPSSLRNPCEGPGCEQAGGNTAGHAEPPRARRHRPARRRTGTPTEPHDDWTWMREHAPVYYDAKSDVWAITKYDDVLAIEKDAKGVLELRRPAPHGDAAADDDQHGQPGAPAAPVARVPRVHAQAGRRARGAHPRASATRSSTGCASAASATSCGTSPRRSRCCSSPTCSASSPSAYDDLLRWSDDLIRATTADPTPEVADGVAGGEPRVPGAAARA